MAIGRVVVAHVFSAGIQCRHWRTGELDKTNRDWNEAKDQSTNLSWMCLLYEHFYFAISLTVLHQTLNLAGRALHQCCSKVFLLFCTPIIITCKGWIQWPVLKQNILRNTFESQCFRKLTGPDTVYILTLTAKTCVWPSMPMRFQWKYCMVVVYSFMDGATKWFYLNPHALSHENLKRIFKPISQLEFRKCTWSSQSNIVQDFNWNIS